MQFRDGGDQAEAKTQPWVATAFIGTIEAYASRVLAAALEANQHAGEWRPQIMRNVVAGAGHALHERFDLVEHSIDDDGQSVERVVDPSGRRSFPQFPGDDALNSLVHLLDALLRTRA
jgi:hypothetical protein